MTNLRAYGKDIKNVFQLIGTLENDITKSIAWGFRQCPSFLRLFIKELLNIDIHPETVRILYQQYEKDKGITDLEITDDATFHMIVEAKQGWLLPSAQQLSMYSKRRSMQESKVSKKMIVTLSECSISYAQAYLPFSIINNIPVRHISWEKIYDVAKESKKNATIVQKNILNELTDYIGGLMSTQDESSNWVYIVSLSSSQLDGCDCTWIDIVQKHQKYFHPLGLHGWPKTPPNYIAFRYRGHLQSIHHIESYVVTKNLQEEIDVLPNKIEDCDYFVYTLGEGIIPSKPIETGNIYPSGRKWAMIDTLLTSKTIEEACNISKKRTNNQIY